MFYSHVLLLLLVYNCSGVLFSFLGLSLLWWITMRLPIHNFLFTSTPFDTPTLDYDHLFMSILLFPCCQYVMNLVIHSSLLLISRCFWRTGIWRWETQKDWTTLSACVCYLNGFIVFTARSGTLYTFLTFKLRFLFLICLYVSCYIPLPFAWILTVFLVCSYFISFVDGNSMPKGSDEKRGCRAERKGKAESAT